MQPKDQVDRDLYSIHDDHEGECDREQEGEEEKERREHEGEKVLLLTFIYIAKVHKLLLICIII